MGQDFGGRIAWLVRRETTPRLGDIGGRDFFADEPPDVTTQPVAELDRPVGFGKSLSKRVINYDFGHLIASSVRAFRSSLLIVSRRD
jgi:hypothetical protein